MIAAVAMADPRFAARLASVLIAAVGAGGRSQPVGPVPGELTCVAEYPAVGADGKALGRVDLRFAGVGSSAFELLVELKLTASYGDGQLARYLAALDPHSSAGWLMAVTTWADPVGESAVADDSRWLGAVRWRDVFAALRELDHCDPTVTIVWRAALDLLREQGDFGPMDLNETAIRGWARRDEAEHAIRDLLTELSQPALSHLRAACGQGADDSAAAELIYPKRSGLVWPWRNQMHLKYAVPATVGEERLRLQFLAADGAIFFTVEARYQRTRERHLLDSDAFTAVAQQLGADFKIGHDGWGYYWARVIPAAEWLHGDATLDHLLRHVAANIDRLVDSGVFEVLADAERS